ncbi:MAG: fumarylacetoacetate hydrolase family protein [Proteobacteria bacterium]|nr:fumarylacetoacetate hydrolase family protein [Pseudomonadota bacterium]
MNCRRTSSTVPYPKIRLAAGFWRLYSQRIESAPMRSAASLPVPAQTDMMLTGTPPGVGFARKPPIFLKHGDEVVVEIEGIGRLCNPVRQAKDS